ncbi:MAG TPA: rhomboid family intramembrane serine protease [Chitinophagaceae bacterium]|nr:rhomboid family intramembrane serine protease [Chitinophagaceae bacterium]
MTEFRPGRFQILPTIIKNLIIINVLVFAAQETIGKSGAFNFDDAFALHTWQSSLFKPWQFVTYMFLHGSIGHIFGNMFALWMFGATLENLWGPKRFLTFYLVCGLGAALCHMVVLYFENQHLVNLYNSWSPMEQQANYQALQEILNVPTLGASGAVFGCLAAFGYLFANEYIYLYFFIPIKAKWFVLAYIGGELMLQIENSAGDTVAHMAHLGGALIGFLMVYFWKNNNRRNFY